MAMVFESLLLIATCLAAPDVPKPDDAKRSAPPTQPAPKDDGAPRPAVSDDDELVRKLLDRATGQGDDEEVMQRVMRLMEASRLRLAGSFDPGKETQRIQKRILDEMEEAIKRSRQRRPSQRQRQQRPGERRQRGQRQGRKPQPGRPQSGKNNQGAKDEQATRGSPKDGQRAEALRESRRQWGNLPPRDREAVIQGFKDDFIPKFKELIERYYKALSVPED